MPAPLNRSLVRQVKSLLLHVTLQLFFPSSSVNLPWSFLPNARGAIGDRSAVITLHSAGARIDNVLGIGLRCNLHLDLLLWEVSVSAVFVTACVV
jgi:hypothetical protein